MINYWELAWLLYWGYLFHDIKCNCRCTTTWFKGPGKREHIVADTLLPMIFLGLRKLGNICCGHKMFLNKIRSIFCVPDTRNKCCARGKTGKHLCWQRCVCKNVSSFARALRQLGLSVLCFHCAF